MTRQSNPAAPRFDSRGRLALHHTLRLHITTEREIARLTGVEPERVARWAAGDELPLPHERNALACHLRITSASWEIAPFGSNEEDR